jgi:cytochrome c biogenesis protein CcmG/thiol:disulfide interchange protein DsbE
LTSPPDAGATDPRPDQSVESTPDPAPGADAAPAAPATAPPRRLRAFLVGLVLAAALALFLFVGLGTTSHPSGSGAGGVVPVGSVAPNFTLPSVVGGAPVDLFALGKHRHHPVVLNFFASWCIPCQKETPLLASTAQAEQAKGSVLQFVGVDAADKPTDAIPFIHQTGITYPVGQDATLQVSASVYGLNAEPNTFFIDESGVVVGHIIGPVSKTELDRWIHKLVGGR